MVTGENIGLPGIGGTIGLPNAGYTEDAEIQAIRGCLAHINKLDEDARSRVAVYLSDRFGPQ